MESPLEQLRIHEDKYCALTYGICVDVIRTDSTSGNILNEECTRVDASKERYTQLRCMSDVRRSNYFLRHR